jgi:hypothetical protein
MYMSARNTLLIVVLAVAIVLPVTAQEHGRSIQAILAEIKQDQNVQRVEQIDPDKVSDAQLAELGEAVMDVQFPNERQHAFMDEMMGGEGSRSLEALHRSIGYSYLSAGGESGWGMMDRSRTGWSMMRPWMMSRYRHFGWGRGMMSAGPGVWILVVLLASAVVVLSIVLATRCNRRPQKR